MVQNSRMVLSWWVFWGQWVHSAQNLSLSLLILMISWVGVVNKLFVSEIHAILGVQIIEIRVFHGFWVEFSAWSDELKWMCKILFPSVTGKAQNS